MLQLLADRFVCDRGWWFDLATARPVRVRLGNAGTRRQQFDWSDRCATLSRLRHPLLNPLVDYGYAASSATFEAYGLLPPMRAGTLGASHTATHAVRFLRAHAIALTRESADLVVRSLRPGGRSGRPFGVVLQPRRVPGFAEGTARRWRERTGHHRRLGTAAVRHDDAAPCLRTSGEGGRIHPCRNRGRAAMAAGSAAHSRTPSMRDVRRRSG